MKTFTLTCVCVALLIGQSRDRELLLDLTSEPAANHGALTAAQHRAMRSGAGTRGTGAPASDIRISASLQDLGQTVFTLGDPLVYDVVLQNTGTTPLALPWASDRALFAGKDVVEAILTLEVRDASGRNRLATLGSQSLLGNRELEGSMVVLQPGERARVRVPARWYLPEREAAAVLGRPGGDVSLAVLAQVGGVEVRSNALEVHVVPRS